MPISNLNERQRRLTEMWEASYSTQEISDALGYSCTAAVYTAAKRLGLPKRFVHDTSNWVHQDEFFTRLWKDGVDVVKIVEYLDRTQAAIYARAKHLGLGPHPVTMRQSPGSLAPVEISGSFEERLARISALHREDRSVWDIANVTGFSAKFVAKIVASLIPKNPAELPPRRSETDTKMFYSPAHRCFVYPVANPEQICAAIAAARRVNCGHVAIPRDLFSLQLARRLGLPAPEIMDLDGYDWPIEPGKSPWRHQKHMANFMALHPRCFNLSDMGTAKTLSTLWAADYLMRQGAIRRCLVVAPLSTLKRVWEDEIFRNFLGRRRAALLYGDRAQRAERLQDDADYYIINHDGLGVGTRRDNHGKTVLGPVAAAIRDRPDIDCVIVDEASAYKDGMTRRFRILQHVVKEKPYLWLLSGTPTPNAPTDAWSLAHLTGALPPSERFHTFKARTMRKLTQYKWVPLPSASATVNRVLQPAIRYSRAECIDLPPCVYVTRDVPLSDVQAQAYATLKRELALTMKDGRTITAVNEAVLRMKLIQIACGAVYGPDREVHRTDAAPRLEVLKEVISEAAGKILIFAPLTAVVELLYQELKAGLGEKDVARVYGGTSQGQRAEIFRAFQQEAHPRAIVADPGTMAHGLTLTAADTIVWFGPTDKPEIFEQANARINRPGQRRNTLIVKLASTPVERDIYTRLQTKASLQGAILKLAEEGR